MGCILKGGGGLYSRVAVGAVLLAAGSGSRMGHRPKSLLELGGVPLIRRQLIALSGAGMDEVVVVLGHYADRIEEAVKEFPVTLVRNPDPEKVSAYECGFNAFDDARMKFDVRFYLVSILFIIFDLEVAFLFPWAVSVAGLTDVAFWGMILFLGVLTVGFAYEWKKGALEWA